MDTNPLNAPLEHLEALAAEKRDEPLALAVITFRRAMKPATHRQTLRNASGPLVQSALRIAGAEYAHGPSDGYPNAIRSCRDAMDSARAIVDFIANLG